MCTDVVAIYDRSGKQIEEIRVPEQPTNVTFGRADRKTLFITAGTSLYSIAMQVQGAPDAIQMAQTKP